MEEKISIDDIDVKNINFKELMDIHDKRLFSQEDEYKLHDRWIKAHPPVKCSKCLDTGYIVDNVSGAMLPPVRRCPKGCKVNQNSINEKQKIE